MGYVLSVNIFLIPMKFITEEKHYMYCNFFIIKKNENHFYNTGNVLE